ncbi:MAG: FAD binding domain-containing protein [Ilumatobacteraceae bacterium]
MSFTIATSIADAIAVMAEGARPVAGGSDLVVGARHGKAPLPEFMVAIDRISELADVTVDGSTLRIGALVTHATLMAHPLIGNDYSGLADASALVGSPSTRNVGTIGGNVMNASPAMDTGAPLLVLGATVELTSIRGSREIPLGELWTGPGRTSALPDELCTAVLLPHRAANAGSAYVRLEYRRAMEIAVVGAAASVLLASNGTIASVDVALTAVAPTIIRVDGIEALAGLSIADAATAIAEIASEQASPISDVRASDRYRRHCVGVMARRALEAAARRAGGESIAIPVNRALGIGAAR